MRHDSKATFPTYRGFDSFYGFVYSYIDPWRKTCRRGDIDIFNGTARVADEGALSHTIHTGALFSERALDVVRSHEPAPAGPDGAYSPLFLYCATPLVHRSEQYQVPEEMEARCCSVNDNWAQRQPAQRV